MSGSSIVKDNSFVLEEVDGDKFSSGGVFIMDSEVFQGFILDLFRPVDMPPELEVKG